MEEGLDSILAYRLVALQETFPGRIGESMTRTRKGRLTPITAPLQAYSVGSTTTAGQLDNGLVPTTWSIEQYTFILQEYAGTQDLNLMAEQSQIADQFIANARNNGVQAAQSLERLMRLKLFGAYLSGNTRLITAPSTSLTSTTANETGAITAGSTIFVNVDDIRGFTTVLVSGQLTAVSTSATQPITVTTTGGAVLTGLAVVGAAPYVGFGVATNTLTVTSGSKNVGVFATGLGPSTISSTPDAQAQNAGNTAFVAPAVGSTVAPTFPLPGALAVKNTTGATITWTTGAGDAVAANDGPQIFRPFNRPASSGLIGTDVLSLAIIEDAVAYLRDNGVPPMDDGTYHCILDNTSLRQLFADQDFKVLFAGRSQSPEWREGDIIRLLGVTYVPTTEAYIQVPSVVSATNTDSGFTAGGPRVRRPIICGAESAIQGNFEGMETWLSQRGFDRADSNIAMVDGIVQIVREPLDRLQQIVSMTWTWIGDYAVPTDATATSAIIPTASNARYRRSAIVEHAG